MGSYTIYLLVRNNLPPMRCAELSRVSGFPIPTIKYYVREGLLPSGELTSPNQARYGDRHIRRLRLIHALTEIGGLSIAATREVLAAIDSPDKSLHDTLGKAQYATTPTRSAAGNEEAHAAATRDVDALLEARGWRVKSTSPSRKLLIEALAALHDLEQDDLLALIDDYADAAATIAAREVTTILGRPDRDSAVEGVVVGTLIGDTILAALRRLAQEHLSAQAVGGTTTERRQRPKPTVPGRRRASPT
jgi:DNA-binding transcriptional MerR regulator